MTAFEMLPLQHPLRLLCGLRAVMVPELGNNFRQSTPNVEVLSSFRGNKMFYFHATPRLHHCCLPVVLSLDKRHRYNLDCAVTMPQMLGTSFCQIFFCTTGFLVRHLHASRILAGSSTQLVRRLPPRGRRRRGFSVVPYSRPHRVCQVIDPGIPVSTLNPGRASDILANPIPCLPSIGPETRMAAGLRPHGPHLFFLPIHTYFRDPLSRFLRSNPI